MKNTRSMGLLTLGIAVAFSSSVSFGRGTAALKLAPQVAESLAPSLVAKKGVAIIAEAQTAVAAEAALASGLTTKEAQIFGSALKLNGTTVSGVYNVTAGNSSADVKAWMNTPNTDGNAQLGALAAIANSHGSFSTTGANDALSRQLAHQGRMNGLPGRRAVGAGDEDVLPVSTAADAEEGLKVAAQFPEAKAAAEAVAADQTSTGAPHRQVIGDMYQGIKHACATDAAVCGRLKKGLANVIADGRYLNVPGFGQFDKKVNFRKVGDANIVPAVIAGKANINSDLKVLEGNKELELCVVGSVK